MTRFVRGGGDGDVGDSEAVLVAATMNCSFRTSYKRCQTILHYASEGLGHTRTRMTG